MKKLFAVLLAVLMLTALAVPALAASDINAAEQKVLDKVSQIVEQDGRSFSLKESDINLAKNFLMKDEIDLSDADAEELIKRIQVCYDIVLDSGLESEDLTKMPQEDRRALLDAANDAGELVGIEVVWNSTEWLVYFNYGNTVAAKIEPTIKITGPDYTMVFVLMGAAVLVVAALAVVAVKKTARAK